MPNGAAVFGGDDAHGGSVSVCFSARRWVNLEVERAV